MGGAKGRKRAALPPPWGGASEGESRCCFLGESGVGAVLGVIQGESAAAVAGGAAKGPGRAQQMRLWPRGAKEIERERCRAATQPPPAPTAAEA